MDAFSVLSNPLRKSMYDKELGFFVNLYSGAGGSAPTSTPMNFVHQNFSISMPTSNADQVFVNMPSQDQVSNAAGVSFSRDPQPRISMPVTASSDIEQQQHVTFLRQQAQPVSSISFSKADEQPATFLNLNQPQPVNSVRSLNRENPPQGREEVVSGEQDGSQQQNPPQGREQVVSGEKDGSQQAPERNENVVGNNAGGKAVSTSDNVKEKEGNADGSGKRIPSFWTACPYCLIMFEYSVDYIGCNLRCQNCKKAFQAVPIASPPPIIDGKEVNFCSWGFMPFGLSLEDFDRSVDDGSSWSPFSPMFTCPRFGGNGGSSVKNHAVGRQHNLNNLGSSQNAGGSMSGGGRKHSAPRIYVLDDDDDDVFVEVSESDEDWTRDKESKKTKKGKRKSARTATASKNAKKQRADKADAVEGNNDINLQDGLATQGGVELSHVVAVESSKRGVASNTRRQPGKVAKHFGNLDLNVEFSNEVEEPKIQMSSEAGEGEDNTVEVIGFFEGLDEFLNSLPILNAVDGDKVEAS